MGTRKRNEAADKRLRREYGLTLDEYALVLGYQKGVCAICKRPAKAAAKRLSVDHCHVTGLLRGLLCNWCNRAIARFHDSIVLLGAAVEYLQLPPITEAFGKPRFTAPGRVGSKKRAKLLRQMQEDSARQKPEPRTIRKKASSVRRNLR